MKTFFAIVLSLLAGLLTKGMLLWVGIGSSTFWNILAFAVPLVVAIVMAVKEAGSYEWGWIWASFLVPLGLFGLGVAYIIFALLLGICLPLLIIVGVGSAVATTVIVIEN